MDMEHERRLTNVESVCESNTRRIDKLEETTERQRVVEELRK